MARRKNTKRFDPRYFMDEKTDLIKEGFTTTGPDPSKALSQQQIEAIIKLKGMDWWKKAGPHINGENIFDFLDPAYASEIMGIQENAMPAPADEMAQAEELAALFQKSPAIMAAVEEAAQDPEVQAAAQEALAQGGTMQEHEDPMGTAYQKRADRAGMGTAVGAGLGISGTAAMFAPGALALVGQAAAGTAVAALGFTAGPALMAIGMILMMKMDSAEGENRWKAEMPHLRKRSDFSDEEYRKMYNKD